MLQFVDFVLVTLFYFITAAIVSYNMNKYFGNFKKEEYDKISLVKIGVEVFVHLVVFSLFVIVMRSIVRAVPIPYVTSRLHRSTDVTDGIAISFVYLLFQDNLKKKIKYLLERVHQGWVFFQKFLRKKSINMSSKSTKGAKTNKKRNISGISSAKEDDTEKPTESTEKKKKNEEQKLFSSILNEVLPSPLNKESYSAEEKSNMYIYMMSKPNFDKDEKTNATNFNMHNNPIYCDHFQREKEIVKALTEDETVAEIPNKKCKCGNTFYYVRIVQLRSADEGANTIFQCSRCNRQTKQ